MDIIIDTVALDKARQQFERHEFWDCHETLEHLWLVAPEPTKTFYQGVIQVAAGFVHIQKRNPKGANSLLKQGLDKLNSVEHHPPIQAAMKIHVFITDAQAALDWVKHATPENWQATPPQPLITIPRFVVTK